MAPSRPRATFHSDWEECKMNKILIWGGLAAAVWFVFIKTDSMGLSLWKQWTYKG